MPTADYDEAEVKAEADRITALGLRDYNTAILVGVLRFLPHARTLKDLCIFTGRAEDVFSSTAPEAAALADDLEREMFGPRPEGFSPAFETGFSKGLPGEKTSINYPGPYHYPANAVVYASKHRIPLVNDRQSLPVPGLPGVDAKHNAKLLASILAVECVSLVLPRVKALAPQQLVDVRDELQPHVKPFRLALLRFAKELNQQISESSTTEEIVNAAQFIVKTEVYPALEEFRAAAESPARSWYERSVALAKEAPSIVSTFASEGGVAALGKASATLADFFLNERKARKEQEAQLRRSGLYYLLKLNQSS